MKREKPIFTGCATALVTPFKDGKIDYGALGTLIDFQIDNGVSALVVLGTTGESPTIRDEERDGIVEYAKKKINGRVPLIVGTGSNCTEKAIKMTQGAQKLGADAALVVTPYYNKATERSLIEHYKTIARATELPIILYNVPSRTSVKITAGVLDGLAEVDNIVAVKEASGDISELEGKMALFINRYDFYSGCDELVLPTYSLGGKGVISAVSNAIPKEMATLCALFEAGDTKRAAELALKISPFIKEMFAEVNPIPVKCALSVMGLCENSLRLPLAPSSREDKIREMIGSNFTMQSAK